mgnify:CR=1 FL=1
MRKRTRVPRLSHPLPRLGASARCLPVRFLPRTCQEEVLIGEPVGAVEHQRSHQLTKSQRAVSVVLYEPEYLIQRAEPRSKSATPPGRIRRR